MCVISRVAVSPYPIQPSSRHWTVKESELREYRALVHSSSSLRQPKGRGFAKVLSIFDLRSNVAPCSLTLATQVKYS